jgi:hypothetical protein
VSDNRLVLLCVDQKDKGRKLGCKLKLKLVSC